MEREKKKKKNNNNNKKKKSIMPPCFHFLLELTLCPPPRLSLSLSLSHSVV